MVGSSREERRVVAAGKHRCLGLWIAMAVTACLFSFPTAANAQTLDDLLKTHVPKLREVERYQLNIAQKYFAEKKWKVAMAEYEKYLTLYEASDAAAYVQLKWSLCLVQLRKQNTAIKEGFQSVIDYWPNSSEAVWASYYIASTYKSIGRIPNAKRAYKNLLAKKTDHLAAAYGMWDMAEIAGTEKDKTTRAKMLKQLTFEVKRARASKSICQKASYSLSDHLFRSGAFLEGVKALETTYAEDKGLVDQVVNYVRTPISQMTGTDENRAKGNKLADAAVAYVKEKSPAGASDEEKATARRYGIHVVSLLSAARRNDDVVKAYQALLKRFGVDDELLGHFAGWYKSQNKYDEARTVYRRFKNPIEGLNQVAYSYRQQSKPQSAVPIYRDLAGRDSENQIRWKSEEARCQRDARKFAEAIAVYRELMKLDVPHLTDWLWQVAVTHQEAGQHKEAIGVYRQCDERFPENYKNMAWCHRKLKQQKEAVILYSQIIGGHEASAPWAQLQVGYTYEELKAKESAIKAFQLVCKKYPKNSHASIAHAHLQNKYKISVTLGGAKDQ